ncbi:MAG TPA: hypothetical protein VFE46_15535 [Pirellulales bacterium]|jgi:hypothetical protein|nr:hypothetical protein [Pirellulales bacterium]
MQIESTALRRKSFGETLYRAPVVALALILLTAAALPIAVYQLMHGSGKDRLAGIALFMVLGYAAVGAILLVIWRFGLRSSDSGARPTGLS